MKNILFLVFLLNLSLFSYDRISELNIYCEEDKNSFACNEIGYAYQWGIDIKKNLKKANIYYRKGCNLGNTGACNNLAYSYEKGLGMVKNYDMAIKLYTNACSKKNGISCNNLAYIYYDIKNDLKSAKKYFKKSCDLGYKVACKKYSFIK